MGYEWDPEELECVQEQKLNKAEIETLNDPWDKPTSEDNKVLNDFLECSWKKQGTINENGEINWDKVDDIIAEEVKKNIEDNKSNSAEVISSVIAGGFLQNAVNKCREENIHGSSPGQTAAKVQNCVGIKLRKSIETFDD